MYLNTYSWVLHRRSGTPLQSRGGIFKPSKRFLAHFIVIGRGTVTLFDHDAGDRLEDGANMFGRADLRDGKSWIFHGVGLGTKHWGLVSRLPCFLEGNVTAWATRLTLCWPARALRPVPKQGPDLLILSSPGQSTLLLLSSLQPWC